MSKVFYDAFMLALKGAKEMGASLKGGTKPLQSIHNDPFTPQQYLEGAVQLEGVKGGRELSEAALADTISVATKETFERVRNNTLNHIKNGDFERFKKDLEPFMSPERIEYNFANINNIKNTEGIVASAKFGGFKTFKDELKTSMEDMHINKMFNETITTASDWVAQDSILATLTKHVNKEYPKRLFKEKMADINKSLDAGDMQGFSEKLKPHFEEADIQGFIKDFQETGKKTFSRKLFTSIEETGLVSAKTSTFEEVLASPYLNKKEALIDVQGLENAGRAMRNGTVEEASSRLSSVLASRTNTLTNKMSHIVATAKRAGMTLPAKMGVSLKKHLDTSEGLAARVRQNTDELVAHLKQYTDEEQLMMKVYRTKKALANTTMSPLGLHHDPKAKQAVEDLFKKPMSEDMLRTDNMLSNFYEAYSQTHYDIKDANYRWSEILPRSIKELDHMKAGSPTAPSFNYHHNVASDEFLASLKEARPTVWSELQRLGGDNMAKSSYIWKQKNENSAIAQDLAKNSKSMAEEIQDYGYQFAGTALNHYGKVRFNDFKDSIAIVSPLVTGKAAKLMPKNELGNAMLSMEKQMEDSLMKVRQATGLLEKGIAAAVDVNTTALIANPSMFTLGFVEIANTIAYKGVWNTAAGLVKGSKLVAEMYAGKWLKKDPFAYLNGHADPDTMAIVNKYAAENPHMFIDVAHDADIATISNKPGLKYLFNVARFSLAAITNIGRMTSLMAASEMAKSKLPEFYKIKETPQAIDWLIKNMHLNEFDEVTKGELIDLALRGKTKDFNYMFTKASTQVEIYDPSKFNRAAYIDASKRAGGILAMSMRFTSYPAYYINTYLASLNRSWQAGDRAPLLRMVAIGAAMAGASYEASKTDNPMTKYVGEWGMKHIPILDPVTGLMASPSRAIGGMLVAPISTVLYPAIYGIRQTYKAIGSENKSVDFLEMNAWKSIKYQPIVKTTMSAIELAKEELR